MDMTTIELLDAYNQGRRDFTAVNIGSEYDPYQDPTLSEEMQEELYYHNPELSLDDAQLQDCLFARLNLQNMDIRRATFTNCTFQQTELHGTDFELTKFIDCTFDNASFMGVIFGTATMQRCNFINIDPEEIGTDFTAATLKDCTLDGEVIGYPLQDLFQGAYLVNHGLFAAGGPGSGDGIAMSSDDTCSSDSEDMACELDNLALS